MLNVFSHIFFPHNYVSDFNLRILRKKSELFLFCMVFSVDLNDALHAID